MKMFQDLASKISKHHELGGKKPIAAEAEAKAAAACPHCGAKLKLAKHDESKEPHEAEDIAAQMGQDE